MFPAKYDRNSAQLDEQSSSIMSVLKRDGL